MKREVTIVPKDKCPLDVLAELGDRTKNAWIFMHSSVVRKMKDTADYERLWGDNNIKVFSWSKTDKYPATTLFLDTRRAIFNYFLVTQIDASDIAFRAMFDEPAEIFFLKMEEE